jgi:hypothetical protein
VAKKTAKQNGDGVHHRPRPYTPTQEVAAAHNKQRNVSMDTHLHGVRSKRCQVEAEGPRKRELLVFVHVSRTRGV